MVLSLLLLLRDEMGCGMEWRLYILLQISTIGCGGRHAFIDLVHESRWTLTPLKTCFVVVLEVLKYLELPHFSSDLEKIILSPSHDPRTG